MSTPITLSVGGIDLTYNTQFVGVDHGHLFQDVDHKRRASSHINYEYFKDRPDELAQRELCLHRSLGSLIGRIELLGYTMEAAKAEYTNAVALHQEERGTQDGSPGGDKHALSSFEAFMGFVRKHAVEELSDVVPTYEEDDGRDGQCGRFAVDPGAPRLPRPEAWDI